METGRVKWYNIVNGSGYIRPDNGGDDLLAVRDNLSEDLLYLKENQKVIFEIKEDDNRNIAFNIKLNPAA